MIGCLIVRVSEGLRARISACFEDSNVFGMYLECIWNVFGMYLECIWNVLGMYLECIGNVFRMYLDCSFQTYQIGVELWSSQVHPHHTHRKAHGIKKRKQTDQGTL